MLHHTSTRLSATIPPGEGFLRQGHLKPGGDAALLCFFCKEGKVHPQLYAESKDNSNLITPAGQPLA